MKILNKVQRRGCLGVLNAMRSTPTHGMEVMLGLQPMYLHLRLQAITTFKRLLVNGNWRFQVGEILNPKCHTNIMRKLTRNFNTLELPRDKLIHTEYVQTNFVTEILPREIINQTKMKPKPEQKGVIRCFTDGSKFGKSTGYGYIIWGDDVKFQGFNNLGEHTTVYQTELIAISEATFTILSNNIINKNITFYVDNQACIKTLGGYIIRSKIAYETKKLLNLLSYNNQVTVSWIPGHEGHLGNEVADRLARMGTRLQIQGPGHIIPLAEATINDEIKQYGRRMHQKFWDRHLHCRQTKMMLPKTNNKLWKQLSKQPRRMMNLITQLFTGHSTLKRHLSVMSIEDDGRCNQCEEDDAEETVEHFLCECPAFGRNRRNSLGNISLSNDELPKLPLNRILKFVKSTKRFEED